MGSKIKKGEGNSGRKNRTELEGLLSTSPVEAPSAQADMTYMHWHSHTPMLQLFLLFGIYYYNHTHGTKEVPC